MSPAAPPRSPSQASRLSASPLGPRREIRLNRRQRRAMHLAKLLRNAALSFDAAAASFAIHVDAYMSHAFDGPRLISGRGKTAIRSQPWDGPLPTNATPNANALGRLPGPLRRCAIRSAVKTTVYHSLSGALLLFLETIEIRGRRRGQAVP